MRAHVIKLNKCLYNRETETDDFILYGVSDDDCRVDAVILHVNDDFFRTPQAWAALMIQRKPYLISKEDCLALERIDDTLYVDLRRIINIPFTEESEMVIDIDAGSSLSASSSAMSASTKTKAPTQSSFYERYNETIIRPMRKKHAIFVETPYQLFSLARHINDGCMNEAPYQTDQDMTQYIKTVIDYALIGINFPNKEHRLILENKLLSHYNNALTQNNETLVFLDFMLNVIICDTDVMPIDVAYFDETSIRYQYCTEIRCKMMNECIAWEIFKLKRSRDRFSLDDYQRLIDEFLLFIDTIIPSASSLIPRPEWTRYCVVAPNVFWHSEKYDQLSIRFEWLPALIKEGLSAQSIVSDRLRNGFVWLNTNEFHDYFLPCLYRNLLTDSFRYIWMCRLSHREDKFVQSLVNIEQENFKALIWQSLPSVGNTHGKTLLEYSNGPLIHITSPITRKLAKRERIIPRRGNNSNDGNNSVINTNQLAASIAASIDIEEINQHMPPCIKPIIKKGVKLQYMDRVTAVSYLVDMNYSMGDAVRLLNGTDKRDIIGHYTCDTKKKQKEPDRMLSLCCNALIVVDGSRGHTARCPYEERTNGDKRRKKTEHTYDDKISYRSQCSASLGPNNKQVSHPIDYIRHKISNNTS